MKIITILFTITIGILASVPIAKASDAETPKKDVKKDLKQESKAFGRKDMSIVRYEYKDRDHTTSESAKIVTLLYGLNWIGYYLSQPDEFRENGSWENYKRNFGEIVFDKDAPFWNLMVHPLTGSQMYLFFRANGYSQQDSFFMSVLQSTLFEFTIEIYTEPASVQDLYQTPVLGSILGYGIEKLSLNLLNSGTRWKKYLGHIINPWTLFDFFEGRTYMTPTFENNKFKGIQWVAEF